MPYTVTCTHDFEELLKLKASWEALQAHSQNRCVFFSWEWIATFWQHYGDTGELWLLLAHDENRHLVGIAPLMCRERHMPGGGLRWCSLEFIADSLGNVHADFIIANGLEEPVLGAFLAWLNEHRVWDEIRLVGLPVESPTSAVLQKCPARWDTLEHRDCPYIALPEDWDVYFGSLSKHKRRNQRSYRRKLDELYPGQWAVQRLEDPEAVRQALDKVILWHQAKWTDRNQPGNFGTGRFSGVAGNAPRLGRNPAGGAAG